MDVNPSISVVHLTMRHEEHELGVGSGVLYRIDEKYYIVTAWHNVTGRDSYNLKCLDEVRLAVPNNVVASIACVCTDKDAKESAIVRRPFVIPIEDCGKSIYLCHPQSWPRIDVVAIPIDPIFEYQLKIVTSTGERYNVVDSISTHADEYGGTCSIVCIQDFEKTLMKVCKDFSSLLAVSDNLFILGYPRGITDMSWQPIWKQATVATDPIIGWKNQKRFLVDCASRQGMSGAPAIYYNRGGTVEIDGKTHLGLGQVTFFHGIYTGRIGNADLLEAQIGMVWKRSLVDEVVSKGVSINLNDISEMSPADIRDKIQELWPSDDAYAKKLSLNNQVAWAFVDIVMQKLNGMANPEDVKAELMKIVESKLELKSDKC